MLEKRSSIEFQKRIDKLFNDIEKYAVNKPVEIVVVSKKQCVEKMEKIYQSGFKHFAENIPQEIRDKKVFYSNNAVKLSFIGNIQKNKIKYIFDNTSLIQSIDSLDNASAVNDYYMKNNRIIDILLQIKVSDEVTKHGFEKNIINEVFEKIKEFKFLKVKGIMCIGPNTDNKEIVEKSFYETFEIFKNLKKESKDFEIISMGMTNDYIIALKNGSNMIRLGRYFYEGL